MVVPRPLPTPTQIQAAYERLQAGVAGGQGPQPWRLLLLLRAQCVMYGRYGPDLAPFKYAGYSLLLEAIRGLLQTPGGQAPSNMQQQPPPPPHNSSLSHAASLKAAASMEVGASLRPQQPGGHFLLGDSLSQAQASSELCWLTVAACRLNAQELARCGGVETLAQLLSRCAPRASRAASGSTGMQAGLSGRGCRRACRAAGGHQPSLRERPLGLPLGWGRQQHAALPPVLPPVSCFERCQVTSLGMLHGPRLALARMRARPPAAPPPPTTNTHAHIITTHQVRGRAAAGRCAH